MSWQSSKSGNLGRTDVEGVFGLGPEASGCFGRFAINFEVGKGPEDIAAGQEGQINVNPTLRVQARTQTTAQ